MSLALIMFTYIKPIVSLRGKDADEDETKEIEAQLEFIKVHSFDLHPSYFFLITLLSESRSRSIWQHSPAEQNPEGSPSIK